MTRKTIYLANPLGFSSLQSRALNDIISALKNSFEVYEPFKSGGDHGEKITAIEQNPSITVVEAKSQLDELNMQIGKKNEAAIRASDIVVAILDGMPEDTGVSAEIGFAYALGKKIFGLRYDFRYCADNLGSIINLQVHYFIRASGGKITKSIEELVKELAQL